MTRYGVLDRYTRYNARRRAGGTVRLLAKRVGSGALGRLIPWLERRKVPCDACDLLFIHGWAARPRMLTDLTRALEQRDLKVRHCVRHPRPARVRHRLFRQPGSCVPVHWRLDAHYAAYLLDVYRPRIVVLFENYSPFASVLRTVAQGDAWTVNLGHSVTPPGDEANMFDFDYCFVLGPSSVDHSRSKRVRVGSTRLVESGSVLISPDFSLPPSRDRTTILFFSQLSEQFLRAPDVKAEEKALVWRNTRLVIAFAGRHPEFQLLVRLHPLERPDHVCQLVDGLPNVRVLEPGLSMKEAVGLASVAVVMWSNAAIEAAVLGRPVVMLNDSDRPEEYLELERFFQSRARTPDELGDRVRSVYADYERHRAAAAQFVSRHLTRTTDAVPFIADSLARLAGGRHDFPYIELHERLDGLFDRGGR